MSENYREDERNIIRKRASRMHQGLGHWHVEKRSSVIICRNCKTHIPKWKNPKYCPSCGDGK
jgi:rubrerythrin